MPSKESLSLRSLKNIGNTDSQDEPILNPKSIKQPMPKIQRTSKSVFIEESRAKKLDLLIAIMKNDEDKKKGPELIDEALDLLFEKYSSKI